jgi:hypothetical protein
MAILGICLAGPVAQAFDWWDQSSPATDDTETNAVVVALSAGLALAVASAVLRWFQSFASRLSSHRWFWCPSLVNSVALNRLSSANSPPSPLRI